MLYLNSVTGVFRLIMWVELEEAYILLVKVHKICSHKKMDIKNESKFCSCTDLVQLSFDSWIFHNPYFSKMND